MVNENGLKGKRLTRASYIIRVGNKEELTSLNVDIVKMRE